MELDFTKPTPLLLANCQMMLNQLLAAGEKPLMFIMSRGTQKAITDLQPHPKPTWWQRVRRKQPKILNVALNGVPIVPNEYMPDGMVHLQALPRISDGGFVLGGKGYVPNEMIEKLRQQAGQGAVAPTAKTADEAPTLEDLIQNDGKPTPTDVLVKAMENIERVRHIAVLSIEHNGSVYAGTNMDNTTLMGAIQKFHVWCATNQGN